MKVALYLRVSTDRQTYENQLLQLTEFCRSRGLEISDTYQEVISGKERDRPEFKRMLQDAGRHKFNAVVVWALDRFTREGTDRVWHYLTMLKNFNVGFLSYSEPYLNTDNDLVRDILYSILGALAKQERIRMSERTKAGLERAKKEGKHIGRKRLYNDSQEAEIFRLADSGMRYTDISRQVGIPAGSVDYALKKRVKNLTTVAA